MKGRKRFCILSRISISDPHLFHLPLNFLIKNEQKMMAIISGSRQCLSKQILYDTSFGAKYTVILQLCLWTVESTARLHPKRHRRSSSEFCSRATCHTLCYQHRKNPIQCPCQNQKHFSLLDFQVCSFGSRFSIQNQRYSLAKDVTQSKWSPFLF